MTSTKLKNKNKVVYKFVWKWISISKSFECHYLYWQKKTSEKHFSRNPKIKSIGYVWNGNIFVSN